MALESWHKIGRESWEGDLRHPASGPHTAPDAGLLRRPGWWGPAGWQEINELFVAAAVTIPLHLNPLSSLQLTSHWGPEPTFRADFSLCIAPKVCSVVIRPQIFFPLIQPFKCLSDPKTQFQNSNTQGSEAQYWERGWSHSGVNWGRI